MTDFSHADFEVEDVACTICGCVCDDLKITISQGRVTETEGACELARPFFEIQQPFANWPTFQLGQPCSRDAGIRQAVAQLRSSRSPLIYGLSRSSSAGQRAATRLADFLGATIDTTASRCHAPSILALQQVGESTCSLGEARHHCDLVVFWGSNPAKSHPRHGERYSMTPPGQFLPGGRADRRVIVIDPQETETAQLADRWLPIEPGADFEATWALRSLIRGQQPQRWPEGISPEGLSSLAQAMKSCRSGIVYFGLGLTRHGTAHTNVEALLRLVTDLNAHTRFYARRMRIPGDVAGADSVLCWQSGFPFSVNLSRCYPRYIPGEYSANELLERNEVDCCLLVGSEGYHQLSPVAQDRLRTLPTIVLDYPTTTCPFEATVQFTTSVYGIHQQGTAYRMDETPIPLRPVFECGELDSDAAVLGDILAELKTGNGS